MAGHGDTLFTYHDATLYQSDLSLLEPGHWLNDHCIVFRLEIAFLHPGATFMFHFVDDAEELRESFEGAALDRAELILAPVNDNAEAEAAGGSHWGLLAYHRADDAFLYLDSHAPGNLANARAIAPKLAALARGGAPRDVALAVQRDCPQQENGSDCGVFVLAFAEHLAAQTLGRTSAPLQEAVTQRSVTALRDAIRRDAQAMAS